MRRITKINLEFDAKSFAKYPHIKQKFIEAADEIEKVINTGVFKSKIMSHYYKGEPTFADCNISNEEVFQTIMSGMEKLSPTKDYVWNIKIILYYSWKNVYGYTYPNRSEIWANRKVHGRISWTVADAAMNLTHEYAHKLGFTHTFRRVARWAFTVPYAVGRIVKELVKANLGIIMAQSNENQYIEMGIVKRAYMIVRRFITRWF